MTLLTTLQNDSLNAAIFTLALVIALAALFVCGFVLWAARGRQDPADVVEDSGAGEAEGEAAEPAPANRRGNRDGDDPAKSQDGLWKALQAGLADWQRRTDATRPQVLLLVSSVLDREVATTTDLTVSDAHRVLDALKGNPA